MKMGNVHGLFGSRTLKGVFCVRYLHMVFILQFTFLDQLGLKGFKTNKVHD